jgi:ribosome-binding protein aMBF1 (putative translation factor)
MSWCSKCGVSGDKERLFDAISDKGIVKICQKCIAHEKWPIIKRPADLYPKKSPVSIQPLLSRDLPVKMGKDSKSMFDRLTRISGVVMSEKKQEDPRMIKQNQALREMANRNFESKIIKEKGDASGLIDNFNWAIMRARRAMHITQEQLAQAIGESEAAIRRAEQGILLGGGIVLIRKIENHLKIHLFKNPQQNQQPELGFDSVSLRNITISDLRNMKKEERESIKNAGNLGNMPVENTESGKQEEKELSDQEVDYILFGDKPK